MSIEIEKLTFIYNQNTAFEKKALDDISLTINSGEFIGLIGHTGSGKSTLIQHLNVLLKPTSGRILIDGEDIRADKSRLKEIRRRVGLVFQYPEHQLFETTVLRDVAFGPRNMGFDERECDGRARDALHIVGIREEDYAKSPFELSGGQRRRVAIAGVLAMRPEILILDEPTAGLDPRGRDDILSQIKRMHTELKITVILVSHSMEDVSRLVERVIVMHAGRIALSGSPGEVFAHSSELEAMGLAVPQISRLMHELREKGYNVPEDVFTIQEAIKVLADVFG